MKKCAHMKKTLNLFTYMEKHPSRAHTPAQTYIYNSTKAIIILFMRCRRRRRTVKSFLAHKNQICEYTRRDKIYSLRPHLLYFRIKNINIYIIIIPVDFLRTKYI